MEELSDTIVCPVCGKSYKQLTRQHINNHGFSVSEFKSKFNLSTTLSPKSQKVRADCGHSRKGEKRNLTEEQKNRLRELFEKNVKPVIADSNRRRTGETRSEEFKARHSEMTKKRWEDGVYDREKLRQRNSEFWKAQHKKYREENPSWYNCRSESLKKTWREGKLDSKEIKGFKYGYYNGVHYRSSYEEQFLKVAFSDNRITDIKAEPWNFPLSTGSVYRPDYSFLFNNKLVYVEIKAKWKLEEFKQKVKYIEFYQYCKENNIPYLIFTEGELWSPDVILREVENACNKN